MTSLLRRHHVERVGIERGDGPVVEHLIRDGFEVVVISARQVKSLRARYGSAGNKDDRFDAFVLADALRTDPAAGRSVRPDSDATVALRMLVRARQDLVGHRIAVHNQLLAMLQHHFPGAVGLFSQLDIPISLAFLRRFPSEARAAWFVADAGWRTGSRPTATAVGTPATELVDHLREAATGRHPAACRRRGRTDRPDSGRSTLHPSRKTNRARVSYQGSAAGPPRRPDRQSLPRAGTVRAATLLAEIGDCRARFPDPQALAAAAGVAPSTRQSGKHLNVTYRRGCNKQLRAALIDWAQDTPRANAWAHDTYHRARARGCRHPHAARILAQGWTRILWRCWHDHTPYNPDLHGRLNTLERGGSLT